MVLVQHQEPVEVQAEAADQEVAAQEVAEAVGVEGGVEASQYSHRHQGR